MGCDIHLYVERRENGVWITADKWTPEEEDGKIVLYVNYDDRFYTGRNYNLFSILADVRNGRGFAGVKTGEGFIPIAEPKGVPEDACPEYKSAVEQYGSDGHSHSFFTISELMEFDWTQTTKLQGYLDIESFEKFERWQRSRGESPDEYCAMISGGEIRHISNEEMANLCRSVETLGYHGTKRAEALQKAGHNCYTLCEWVMPYHKCAEQFLSNALPRLWRLGKPDDVRIVFFFDN